ncbi:hypothetical protein ROJ8625_00928 [Roseivivax jejudonensis]|uniref:Uncharacterized protein n=1 Tax=Roseivivax jejudonensis TaxID=1529041 RepID=A0A1X6YJ40_9RHOB|nr:hypothetical protein [Roseivivax jejudonensis]SLN23233.1 hypothetical protein ROJ8625_00928 [Roseivivax jejudonensis]
MTEADNIYNFNGAGTARMIDHALEMPDISTDEEFAHYARELVRCSEGQTAETPLEARAMTAAILCKMQAYDRLIEAFDRMDAGEI